MNGNEISKLAHALNELRPDWPISSLTTWLNNHLSKRPYRDAAIACVWVALDMKPDGSWESRTLARVLEPGPWWRAADPGSEGRVARRNPRPDEACPQCGGFAGSCPCGNPVRRGPSAPPPENLRDLVEAARHAKGDA